MVNPQSPGPQGEYRVVELKGDLTWGVARKDSGRPVALFGLRSDAEFFRAWLDRPDEDVSDEEYREREEDRRADREMERELRDERYEIERMEDAEATIRAQERAS